MKRTLLGIIAGALVAGSVIGAARGGQVEALPYYADNTLTPRWASSARELDSAHAIGDFSLRDQQGREVNRAVVANRVYVASFFYSTCQTLCPTLRSELARCTTHSRATRTF